MEDLKNRIHQDTFIKNIVEQIVKLANPISVYLFGSAARGENKINSDLDFLILIPEEIPKRKTAQKLYRDVNSQLVSCDFIVATQSILERNKNNEYMIYYHALKEGILLYGK